MKLGSPLAIACACLLAASACDGAPDVDPADGSTPSPDGSTPSPDGGSAVEDGGAPSPDGGGTTPDGGPTDPPLGHDCTPSRFATADADGAGDGTRERPWTLAQAMAEATAGDVVLVGPGIYTAAATDSRYVPAWNPARSGTEGAPIVFCAEFPAAHNESDRSELRHDGTSASPTFGTLEREHVVWDGFYVNEADSPSTSDTGPVVVWGSTDVTIARSVIVGTSIPRDDNHNGIRLEGVRRVTIAQNRISGVHHAVRTNRNHAAIMSYDASYVTIEHNEIWDCDEGMYLKGDHAGDGLPNGAYAVRFNHLHDIDAHAITLLGVVRVDDQPTEVAHNLVERAGIGLLFNSVGGDHPAFVRVHHNTIVGGDVAFFPNAPSTMFDFEVTQNLVQGARVFFFEIFSEDDLRAVIDNGYLSDDNHAHMYGGDWAFERDLAEWQIFSGLDGESSVGDPLFVDAAAGDYRLAPSSPAATASDTGGPVGCYVSGAEVIGVEPAP